MVPDNASFPDTVLPTNTIHNIIPNAGFPNITLLTNTIHIIVFNNVSFPKFVLPTNIILLLTLVSLIIHY